MKNKTLIALIFPIICLLSLISYEQIIIRTGETIILKVKAYDPRDLLKGHYLNYQIDYEVEDLCPSNYTERHKKEAYICLETKTFSWSKKDLQGCDLFIKGQCRYGRFTANIEKFYVPETQAARLDKLLQDPFNDSRIKLKVNRNGSARVVDFMINAVSVRI